jgi:hypothetical protein
VAERAITAARCAGRRAGVEGPQEPAFVGQEAQHHVLKEVLDLAARDGTRIGLKRHADGPGHHSRMFLHEEGPGLLAALEHLPYHGCLVACRCHVRILRALPFSGCESRRCAP